MVELEDDITNCWIMFFWDIYRALYFALPTHLRGTALFLVKAKAARRLSMVRLPENGVMAKGSYIEDPFNLINIIIL